MPLPLTTQIHAAETSLQEARRRGDRAAVDRLQAALRGLWDARRAEIARERATGRWEHMDPWVLNPGRRRP